MMGCLSLFRKQNLKWLGVLATIIMTFVQLGGALVTKQDQKMAVVHHGHYVMVHFFLKTYQFIRLLS